MATALTIGRKSGSDIVISSPYLSSTHASIELIDLERFVFRIKDLDSTNGTTVNGRRVQDVEFRLGDQVKLGEYELSSQDFLPFFCKIEPVSGGELKAKKARRSDSSRRGALLTLLLGGAVGSLWPLAEKFDISIDRTVVVLSLLFLLELVVFGAFMLRGAWRRSRAEQEYLAQRQQGLLDQLELDLRKRELAMAVSEHSWNGFRKFEVVRKDAECRDVTSFYLKPHDKRPIPSFRPGQYLTFKLNIPGHPKSVVRCYSLSDAPRDEHYRVSIKKAAPPPDAPQAPSGLSSTYFHDQVNEGDILDVKVPTGIFWLDVTSGEPVVLAAGGVGVTPMLSMLNALVEANARQAIWFFYGVKDGNELVQGNHIRALAERYDNVNVVFCFSRPRESDELGRDYHVKGRVTVDLFKEKLGSNNFAFYLCGSGPFMQSLSEGLEEWGVPEDKVNTESFGPSSLVPSRAAAKEQTTAPAANFSVEFSRSGKTVQAESRSTVLEIAEANGIELDYGCRAGNCGTCSIALRSGDVHYDAGHDADIEQGSCLACIAKPAANIVVDA